MDDTSFNLHYHVRHLSLPDPGDERLLKRLAGHVMSLPLDRNRPLWEVWVVEGLEQGGFAVITKGKVKIAINQTYPLIDAERAHRELEGRLTTGSPLLLP